jgi:hypothetical protein
VHVHYKYTSKLCIKYTVHGDNLMFRGIAKFTSDKIHVDTINRHIKTPKTSHNILYYENDSEYQTMKTAFFWAVMQRLVFLNLEDGTDRLSRNVGKKPNTNLCVITQKNAVLIYFPAKARNHAKTTLFGIEN